jgi:tRNA pseudouridine(38-40) synthase
VSRTFKLTIAYEGTDFIGWQRQATGTSIQGLLEDALSELDGRPVAVTGAGRTDAGVHARGQVATAALDRDIDVASVVRAVNIRLPQSVRILDASLAPEGFHARFDARLKTYRYRIWNADVMSPFERSFAWHVPMPLDTEAMNDAAGMLRGTHDFASFQGTGSDTQTYGSDGAAILGRARARRPASCLRCRRRRVFCATWSGMSSEPWWKSDEAAFPRPGSARCSRPAIARRPARPPRRMACF